MYSDMMIYSSVQLVCICPAAAVAQTFVTQWTLVQFFFACGLSCQCSNLKIDVIWKRQIGPPVFPDIHSIAGRKTSIINIKTIPCLRNRTRYSNQI